MAKKQTTTKQAKRPATTAAQLQATMTETREGFQAYERARLALKKDGLSQAAQKRLRATMEQNRPAFSAYWRAFNDPAMRAQRDKARAAKAAKAARATK